MDEQFLQSLEKNLITFCADCSGICTPRQKLRWRAIAHPRDQSKA